MWSAPSRENAAFVLQRKYKTSDRKVSYRWKVTLEPGRHGRHFMNTSWWRDPELLSPQHPVDGLPLVGSEDGDERLVLHVVRLLLALTLVQVPHRVVQLLHVLPLQVRVTFLLLILYDLYAVTTGGKSRLLEARTAWKHQTGPDTHQVWQNHRNIPEVSASVDWLSSIWNFPRWGTLACPAQPPAHKCQPAKQKRKHTIFFFF